MSELYAILVWLSQMSGYALPAEMPEIRFEPDNWTVPCGTSALCSPHGYYQDDDVLHIRASLTKAKRELWVAHEGLHWLQHHSGKFRTGHCRDNFFREIEATRWQNEYAMRKQGATYAMLYAVRPMTCSVEEWDK